MNLRLLGAVLIMLGKLRGLYSNEMLNMLGVTKIVLLINIYLKDLNLFNGIQHMFHISKLTQSLFSDSIVDGLQDPRTSHINLVQMNTKIIDYHENWNIFLFKEAIKIKVKKAILNTGFKASKELQLF